LGCYLRPDPTPLLSLSLSLFLFPFYASLLDPIGLGLPRPTSCLSLLQPNTVGPAIGPVAVAIWSMPPRARPLCCPCDMSISLCAWPPCQPRAAPNRPHRPHGPSPPPPTPEPNSSSTRNLERRTEGKFPHRRPNPIQGESISNGFKSLRDRILSTYVIYLQENTYI
jgi:hypothetical protein